MWMLKKNEHPFIAINMVAAVTLKINSILKPLNSILHTACQKAAV